MMTGMWLPIVAGLLILAGTMTDGAGRTVRVPEHPKRIVSLAPSVTEILFALGAGDRVVGVTDYCDYPAEARTRTRIGGLINPDLERIVSLHPDLVIASTSGNYRDDTERIERIGTPVYAIDTPTVEAILRSIEQVGTLVDRRERAAALVSELRKRIDAVREAAAGRPRVRALFVIEPQPLIVPGATTFVGEALSLAGADLAGASSSGWSQIDMEQVIDLRPEVIFTTEANRSWSEGLASSREWMLVPAVPAGRVYVVSDAIQHPGPRLIAGMEEVSGILDRLSEKRDLGGGAGPTAVPPPPFPPLAPGAGSPSRCGNCPAGAS